MTLGNDIASLLERVASALSARAAADCVKRPAVTLSYAQSLDGSIAAEVGATTFIGSRRSRQLAHQLRALHDAVAVGVNTVLVDDPQLNVRHVTGADPRPVVIDSRLRTPPDARLLAGPSPLVVTTHDASSERADRLADAGAEIVRVTPDAEGRVDLEELLDELGQRGIRSVMIEGGAAIITSVLQQHLANQLVLTISPEWLGGVPAVTPCEITGDTWPQLHHVQYLRLESDAAPDEVRPQDLIVYGELTTQVAAVAGNGRQHPQHS